MKKITAFGASNSKKSINKQLASFAVNQIEGVEVSLLDLNDYEMPIYSVEREQISGIPKLAKKFKNCLNQADGVIISFSENNGCYSTAFKNIFDWISRIKSDSIWEQKKMLLMATSPGPRGGQNVLELAVKTFPFQGAVVVSNFCLPFFQKNFSPETGIKDQELNSTFQDQLTKFKQQLG